MSVMRIVYVSYLHPEITPGGEQQVAYEMFNASLREGHEAFLISALEPSHREAFGKPGSVVVPMPGQERQFFYFPQGYEYNHLSVADWRSTRLLMEHLALLRPDVVHFHHYHQIGVEAIRAARVACPDALISLTFHEMMAICRADGQMVKTKSRQLCEKATPVGCHGCFPEYRPEFFELRARRLRAALEECDLFVFPSEFLADRYVQWGLDVDKCVVVPNGQADLGAGVDRSRRSQPLNRFGFFGQFLDNKGVDLVFQALLIVAREGRTPATGLTIEINAGNRHYASEAYLAAIRRHVDELKAINASGINIVDKGGYDRAELARRMMSIDWVIVPSTWWEVFGLVVSEAWMFGRPVIAADIGGLSERVVDGQTGFRFAARDARALADRIVALAGNERSWTEVNRRLPAVWSDVAMVRAHAQLWDDVRASRRAVSPPPGGATAARIAFGSGVTD